MTYSCHHNSSRFAFPIFAHSRRFSVLHSSMNPEVSGGRIPLQDKYCHKSEPHWDYVEWGVKDNAVVCLYQFHVSVCMVLSDVYVQYLNIRTCKCKTVKIIVTLLKYFMSVPAWISSVACYTGCSRRNVQYFGRVFLMLNYTDITQNTYIQSW